MMIFLSFSQGASSSASGTRVVLPAPGGATSTAALLAASVRASSSSTASIGRGVSKLRGKVSPTRHAREAGDPGHRTSLLSGQKTGTYWMTAACAGHDEQ